LPKVQKPKNKPKTQFNHTPNNNRQTHQSKYPNNRNRKKNNRYQPRNNQYQPRNPQYHPQNIPNQPPNTQYQPKNNQYQPRNPQYHRKETSIIDILNKHQYDKVKNNEISKTKFCIRSCAFPSKGT